MPAPLTASAPTAASAHRRPLATAAVAAAALFAVWFVPSANASPEPGPGTAVETVTAAQHSAARPPGDGPPQDAAQPQQTGQDGQPQQDGRTGQEAQPQAHGRAGEPALAAEDGGFDSTPYLLGGLGLAGLGGLLVARSVRSGRRAGPAA